MCDAMGFDGFPHFASLACRGREIGSPALMWHRVCVSECYQGKRSTWGAVLLLLTALQCVYNSCAEPKKLVHKEGNAAGNTSKCFAEDCFVWLGCVCVCVNNLLPNMDKPKLRSDVLAGNQGQHDQLIYAGESFDESNSAWLDWQAELLMPPMDGFCHWLERHPQKETLFKMWCNHFTKSRFSELVSSLPVRSLHGAWKQAGDVCSLHKSSISSNGPECSDACICASRRMVGKAEHYGILPPCMHHLWNVSLIPCDYWKLLLFIYLCGGGGCVLASWVVVRFKRIHKETSFLYYNVIKTKTPFMTLEV